MKKVIYIIVLLIGATIMAQTITVNGTPMLVSDDISFPFWLESGSSISPEIPVSSISVLEFNIVPNNNGNDMVFNQVISVTSNSTVPEGKTWKVVSVLLENQWFEVENSNSSLFIPTNSSSTNIVMEAPVYDSLLMYVTFNASILPSGGSPITERGFCYSSTNEQPTVYDNITSSGMGAGSFEESFNPLEILEFSTDYFVRSYATSIEGITYSDVHSFTTTSQGLPEIGESYLGGIVFYIDATGEHGLVAATEDLGSYEWGCNNTSIIVANEVAIGSGYQNTLAIIAGCSETPVAASEALNASLNSYTDWYLPTRDELLEMYNIIGNGSADGNIGSFSISWYWSSTEYNTSGAWSVYLSSGNMGSKPKGNANRVRVIRAF